MKKLTALVALALLAIAGTGYAVTCAQDNVPAATLLVPYFRVGGAGVVLPNDIPDNSGTDTLCAVTNVSNINIIIHVSVFNKYSKGVLDFNVPMTPYDVVFWSMRDILNGKLIVNPTYQKLSLSSSNTIALDPCGQQYNYPSMTRTVQNYIKTSFVRFSAIDANDRDRSISVYPVPAFSGSFRTQVWTSLDESYDISNWLKGGAAGAGVIDDDNPACDAVDWINGTVSGDFSGYVLIDLANNCTQHFPGDPAFFTDDNIATAGWGFYPGPNILMGDVFYKDQAPGSTTANIGNISGDPMVHLEFDSRLDWIYNRTFYAKYVTPDAGSAAGIYSFEGDGREPLGQKYGFRYMQTANPTALKTWITVWRSDMYTFSATNSAGGISFITNETNLCDWWIYRRCLLDAGCGFADANYAEYGFTDSVHKIVINLWDNDEGVVNIEGGPSGNTSTTNYFVFLEAQRLIVTPNTNIVPSSFLGGWISLTMPGNVWEQAWVGVQHSGLGLAMSVGHGATLLNGYFTCWGNQGQQTGTFGTPLWVVNPTVPMPPTTPAGNFNAVQTNSPF